MPKRPKSISTDSSADTTGQRLARLRKERGFTQVELAAKLGIIQSLISDYETDRLRLPSDLAVRIATALDVSTDDILRPQAKKAPRKALSLKVVRRMEEIEKLPPRQQTLVLSALDSMLRGATAR
jgi:transcriptional regulator with XRE-family HTH domain